MNDAKIPGGTILALIGLMVLLTPLVTEVTGKELILDLAAGGVLLVVGLFSLLTGLKQLKATKQASQDSSETLK